MKRAFSLVELLVVIGIIATLAGVLIGSFGGATESARAAKCISNLHSLGQAACSYAVRNDNGWYPAAGSYQWRDINAGDTAVHYHKWDGWISWLCNHDEFKTTRTAPATGLKNLPFYGSGDDKEAVFAITNGALGKLTGGNRSLYVCPSHEKFRRSRHKKDPVFSYVMNANFGYDSTKGSGCSSVGHYRFGEISDRPKSGTKTKSLMPERTLMFAEIPIKDWSGGKWIDHEDGEGEAADCVLNYKASVNREYGWFWNGTPEAIGFNHEAGKGKRCAHVCFADGHTEKIVEGSKGIDYNQLTALLCEGKDVSFDGSAYRQVNNSDEEDK